ncbi:hypothetical protein ACG2QI_02135 [Bacillus sp. GM2]|jgi:hypothetical protein|uniref:Uncharacterized protein n=1 Tax=Bacillus licheniformis TaxID=1402 RepID=A0A1Y0YJU0_BACLI|nr:MULTISPECIES: hypothetical protein [Bacillus]MBJ7888204.1 hypothetical protein [Bacillaceae bacterium HSR45]MBY8347853.1 hypothetical protein [Bacillus sp. PCH94]MDP4079806.1 hypothetical protein [Bacillota bacterium]AAU42261.1 hypothetical protein BLi03433 [Bacillus licheniformis DSM 13 = ATCC 14580]AKQ74686.1 hypothetical protein MUY_003554 [Bacillus licheniformis WX-02]
MKKKRFGILFLVLFLLLFNTASQAADPNQKTTEEVLLNAFDKFGLVSSVIGKTDQLYQSAQMILAAKKNSENT